LPFLGINVGTPDQKPKTENQRPDTKRPATPGHNGHSFSKIGGLIYLSANSLSQKAFLAVEQPDPTTYGHFRAGFFEYD